MIPIRYVRYATLAATLVLTVSCSSDKTTSVEEDAVIGTYGLSTIANHALPAVIEQDATAKREVVTSTIYLYARTKCRVDFTYRDTNNGAVTTSEHQNPCTFTVNGQAITLMLTEIAAEQVGTIANNSIKVVDQAGEWIFLKFTPLE